MSIDISSPIKFLRTMRLSHYEIPSDFMLDMHDQLDKLEQELQKTREQLEKCENSLMKVACFETHGENKYISHEQAYTGVANFARQYFQDKDKQGE